MAPMNYAVLEFTNAAVMKEATLFSGK